MKERIPEPLCNCPICGWEGYVWKPVESRPNCFTNKMCVRCGSYPRDRIVRLLLSTYSRELDLQKIRLIEFGESGRTYRWKKEHYHYWNVDLEDSSSGVVDVPSHQMACTPWLRDFDAALISYVLSMIESRSERISVMRQFQKITRSSGRLLLFDDFTLASPAHVKLPADAFFHKLRLGSDILKEVEDAGWNPVVVNNYVDDRRLVSLELPFVVASKGDDSGLLRDWITKTALT
jgi:hypothetical protein